MIQLKCPHGHALTAPDSKVGKSGKCPECGARFRVPGPDDSMTAVESSSSGSGSELQRADPDAKHDRPIVFLCPSGHRLNGPPRLAGKPGQCPHCQEKFLIPSLEELRSYEQDASESKASEPSDEMEQIEELADEHVVSSAETSIGGQGQSDVPQAGDSMAIDSMAVENGTAKDVAGKNGTAKNGTATNGSSKNLAGLFSKLWSMKSEQQSIEITLKSGQSLVPERFSPGNEAAALIASRQTDGKLRVTAIAWDAVATLQLCDVEQLPDDLFKGE